MSVAFLFPGQGSQQEGMLPAVVQFSTGCQIVAEASEILGFDVLRIDSANALQSTRNVQICLLISGVEAWRRLAEFGAHPAMVAGLSVGSFGAAVAAGCLDFSTALRLVSLRGQLMEKAFPRGYGMAVSFGLNESGVSGVLESLQRTGFEVFLAGINSAQQVTVSGSDAGLEAFMAQAKENGATRVQRLRVNVPSHCQLLQPAAERLSAVLRDTPVADPAIPYADNRRGRVVLDAESVRADLGTNLANPMRWRDAIQAMFEAGARLFVELPPGDVLTNLNISTVPEARSVACENSRLELIAELARKEANDKIQNSV
jgi:malonate decarboxylase epsilon subunit